MSEHGGEPIIPFSGALEAKLLDMPEDEKAVYCKEVPARRSLAAHLDGRDPHSDVGRSRSALIRCWINCKASGRRVRQSTGRSPLGQLAHACTASAKTVDEGAKSLAALAP